MRRPYSQRDHVHSSTTLDALAELLGTVVLVEEIVSDLLQVRKVAVQKCGSDSQEVGVARVINLDNTPWILSSTDFPTTNLNNLLRTHNSERHKASELSILLDSIFIILLDVIREVIDGN